MDEIVISLQEAKKRLRYEGKNDEFKRSKELAEFCIKNRLIVAVVHASDMTGDHFKAYFEFLLRITLEFLAGLNPPINVDDLKDRKDCRKAFKILWEFGVIGEIRNRYEGKVAVHEKVSKRSPTSITIGELYEVAKVLLNFSGTEVAFKRQIQRLYGSFAEYCIEKGYDINSTKWENDETALRVARKLGSVEAVKRRSHSLYNYLHERDLFTAAFSKKVA